MVNRRAVLLLSGGHDSAQLLHLLVGDGFYVECLWVDYGQKAAEQERKAAGAIKQQIDAQSMRDGQWCSLTYRQSIGLMLVNDVEWAARNMVLLSMGVAHALATKCDDVFIGCTWEDHRRFPDCRPSFLHHIDQAAKEAYGIRVHAPLRMRPEQVLTGTWSCYEGGAEPCGECLGCHRSKDLA